MGEINHHIWITGILEGKMKVRESVGGEFPANVYWIVLISIFKRRYSDQRP